MPTPPLRGEVDIAQINNPLFHLILYNSRYAVMCERHHFPAAVVDDFSPPPPNLRLAFSYLRPQLML